MRTLKKTFKPQFHYHLTNRNWGDKTKLFPKKDGCNREDSEPDVSRTCVGPDIVRCLLALPYNKGTKYIYRTYHKVYAYYPYEVEDSIITREKWLINPVTFIKIGEIPKKTMRKLPNEATGYVEIQRQNLFTIRKRLDRLIRDKELSIPKYCL